MVGVWEAIVIHRGTWTAELIWLTTGISVELLWTRWGTSRFHTRQRNASLVERLSASHITLCSNWLRLQPIFMTLNDLGLFYPMLHDFRKIIAFWKVPRFRPFVLLVWVTCKWIWEWSIGGMIQRRKNLITGIRRETCPHASLSTTNLAWTDLGSKMGLCGKRLATNCTSHGTA